MGMLSVGVKIIGGRETTERVVSTCVHSGCGCVHRGREASQLVVALAVWHPQLAGVLAAGRSLLPIEWVSVALLFPPACPERISPDGPLVYMRTPWVLAAQASLCVGAQRVCPEGCTGRIPGSSTLSSRGVTCHSSTPICFLGSSLHPVWLKVCLTGCLMGVACS